MCTLHKTMSVIAMIMTSMADCEKEVGDSRPPFRVLVYLCTYSIGKFIHPMSALLCLHKTIEIYTNQRFCVLRNKHTRMLDYKLKTAKYLLCNKHFAS